MLRIYVPSSHSNANWMVYATTARTSGDWAEVTPGAVFNYGDVCSADYRSDKNLVAVTGQMGERLVYTFLPFIILNDFAAPHTYLYDIGFSDPILDPSSRTTGLDSSGNPSALAEQFSNGGATLDAANGSGSNFNAFSNNHFGFQVLGIAENTATIWDLQNTFFWHDSDFAFETSGSRFSMDPVVLARAHDYSYHIGRAGNSILVSNDNPELGYYRPYLYKATNRDGSSWMKIYGTPSYSPADGGTLLLGRTNFLWGFFYFCVVDSAKFTWDTALASNRYETNLITTGSSASKDYLYPQFPNDFSVADHGRWTNDELGSGSNPPAQSRTLWWGTVPKCREARTGWFVTGRKVN